MTAKKFLHYAVPTIIVLILVPIVAGRRSKGKFTPRELKCVIGTGGWRSGIMVYDTGFNYEMLTRFGLEADCPTDIFLADTSAGLLDSLSEGKIDILVAPVSDSVSSKDGFTTSIPLADSTFWIIRSKDRPLSREINRWLSAFKTTEDYDIVLERFTSAGSPFRKKGKHRVATPYDDILKEYASQIGWDWRMLAALVWTESKFHIEARSSRGAAGLMQMVPNSAGRYTEDDLLDPEKSVASGVQYLSRLQGLFSEFASGGELVKFTLAAYNAGEGRILDCIHYAQSIGLPASTWSEVSNMIPSMRSSSINDEEAVKLGIFQGYETMSFVNKVTDCYEAYCGKMGSASTEP